MPGSGLRRDEGARNASSTACGWWLHQAMSVILPPALSASWQRCSLNSVISSTLNNPLPMPPWLVTTKQARPYS